MLIIFLYQIHCMLEVAMLDDRPTIKEIHVKVSCLRTQDNKTLGGLQSYNPTAEVARGVGVEEGYVHVTQWKSLKS